MTEDLNKVEPKLSRIEYLKEIFIQDYKKGIKKSKLIKFNSPIFNSFKEKLDNHQLLLASNSMKSASTRYNIVSDEMSDFVDPAFYAFKIQMGLSIEEAKMKSYNLIFEHMFENDPSQNKEYLNWYLNLYRNILKKRKPFEILSDKILDSKLMQDGTFSTMVIGGDEFRFFEDLYKIRDYLSRFEYLKKTTIIKDDKKDINKYQTYEEFLKQIKPFMTAAEGSADVDTLDHKEMACIQNQIEFEANKNISKTIDGEILPRAKLMYQDDDFIILYTVNKEANTIFGKYTTWCTAGTRHGSMFDNYDRQGYLFVLIEKGRGSQKAITQTPTSRLQFNFESRQFMDADDKPIIISDFFTKYPAIKKYFKDYIVNVALRKLKSYKDHVEFLKKLGFCDELISIYKEMQPEEINLSGFKMDDKNLAEIGDIISLKILTIQDSEIVKIPDSWSKLVMLEKLDISNNKTLNTIPKWFNLLNNLKVIKLNGCDLKGDMDFDKMVNLELISLDFNSNLSKLPKGLLSLINLKYFSASNCDLREVTSDILGCDEMILLDLHHNLKLSKIPLDILRLKNLQALAIDETKISDMDIKTLNSLSRGNCIAIKYKR